MTKGNRKAFVGKNVDDWFNIDDIMDVDGHKLSKEFWAK